MTPTTGARAEYAEWLRGHTLPSGAGRAFADFMAAQTPPPGPDEPDDEPDDEPVQLPTKANGPAPAGLALIITFAGPDSATLRVDATGVVSIGQIFAAAYLLDCMARESRAQQFAAAQSQQIVRAGPSALAGGRWPQRRS